MAEKASAKKAGRPSHEGEPYTKPMSVWFTDAQLARVDQSDAE